MDFYGDPFDENEVIGNKVQESLYWMKAHSVDSGVELKDPAECIKNYNEDMKALYSNILKKENVSLKEVLLYVYHHYYIALNVLNKISQREDLENKLKDREEKMAHSHVDLFVSLYFKNTDFIEELSLKNHPLPLLFSLSCSVLKNSRYKRDISTWEGMKAGFIQSFLVEKNGEYCYKGMDWSLCANQSGDKKIEMACDLLLCDMNALKILIDQDKKEYKEQQQINDVESIVKQFYEHISVEEAVKMLDSLKKEKGFSILQCVLRGRVESKNRENVLKEVFLKLIEDDVAYPLIRPNNFYAWNHSFQESEKERVTLNNPSDSTNLYENDKQGIGVVLQDKEKSLDKVLNIFNDPSEVNAHRYYMMKAKSWLFNYIDKYSDLVEAIQLEVDLKSADEDDFDKIKEILNHYKHDSLPEEMWNYFFSSYDFIHSIQKVMSEVDLNMNKDMVVKAEENQMAIPNEENQKIKEERINKFSNLIEGKTNQANMENNGGGVHKKMAEENKKTNKIIAQAEDRAAQAEDKAAQEKREKEEALYRVAQEKREKEEALYRAAQAEDKAAQEKREKEILMERVRVLELKNRESRLTNKKSESDGNNFSMKLFGSQYYKNNKKREGKDEENNSEENKTLRRKDTY